MSNCAWTIVRRQWKLSAFTTPSHLICAFLLEFPQCNNNKHTYMCRFILCVLVEVKPLTQIWGMNTKFVWLSHSCNWENWCIEIVSDLIETQESHQDFLKDILWMMMMSLSHLKFLILFYWKYQFSIVSSLSESEVCSLVEFSYLLTS